MMAVIDLLDKKDSKNKKRVILRSLKPRRDKISQIRREMKTT